MNNCETFELKWEHIALMMHLEWEVDEAEAVYHSTNSKKPYGNSGYLEDVKEIINYYYVKYGHGKILICPECNMEITPYNEQDFEALHEDLVVAIDIVLRAQTFTPGKYRKCKSYRGYSYELVEK